ncbi:hypothetical protein D3C87_2000690 [compost metagenome]
MVIRQKLLLKKKTAVLKNAAKRNIPKKKNTIATENAVIRAVIPQLFNPLF